ncbi:MAG TPA: lytic transglycosylase domain-containing protein [Solirubrobacteraceae bacterium]|nr:lytic transglycosylase domain-containing protein [Solirubrobacteraceae bacterium]
MSTHALTATAGTPAGELVALQRMQQLAQLIESSRLLASGGQLTTTASTATTNSSYPQTSNADFATALQTATTADVSGVASTATGYPALSYGSSSSSSESSEYDPLIEQAAARNGLDPAVLHGLIQQESGFDPNATSSAGATGLTQLMPSTASSIGVANPLNPAESIEGGARYLGQLMRQFAGNTEDALAAYNAGPGAVQQYGGMPPYAETQSYVTKVLGNAEAYRQAHPITPTTQGLA